MPIELPMVYVGAFAVATAYSDEIRPLPSGGLCSFRLAF